jgi:hypothetical protein
MNRNSNAPGGRNQPLTSLQATPRLANQGPLFEFLIFSPEVYVDSDSVTRSRQLYSLLQPYAAILQALLERLDHENPFKALAEEDQAPKEFVSLARSVSELPVGESRPSRQGDCG